MDRIWHHAWRDMAVFESLGAARALEAYLRASGFKARCYDDKLFRYFLFLRPPRVTYRVQVSKHGAADAGRLSEANAPAMMSKALNCPGCGSLRVNYPQMTRRFVLPTILMHLGIIFHVVEHECYCEDCHYMWNLPSDRPHRKIRTVRWFPF